MFTTPVKEQTQPEIKERKNEDTVKSDKKGTKTITILKTKRRFILINIL